MRKGFLVGLTVLGVLFVLVMVAPWLISLNQYKALIQQKAFEATGREVVVNGDVRLGILPSPYARLTDVVIKNPPGAKSQQFATIKAVDVGVALRPLLSKKIQMTHITITEPAVTLETMANGGNNWQFQPVEKAETAVPAPADAATADNGFSIDDLTVEKAYIRIVNVPQKSQQMIGPLDAKFNIASLQGPISGKGSVTVLNKLPLQFETLIDTLPQEENGVIPFTLDVALFNDMAKGNFKGQWQKGEQGSARVESAVAIKDLPAVLGAVKEDNASPALPAWLQGAASLNGLVEWRDETASIDNLMIKSGGMEINAALKAEMKDKTSVTLDLARVALPPETPGVATGSTAQSADKPLAQTLADGFAQISGLLDTALPTTPLDVVVTAAQLPLPGQPVWRDVRLAASTDASGLTVQNVEMKLPGNTQVKANGVMPARQDGKMASAKINAQINSQDLQAALGKAGGEATPLNLQTTALVTRESLRLQPVRIIQNGQTVNGEITYTPKAANALAVALTGSALNLDSLLGNEKKKSSVASGMQDAVVVPQADPLAKLQGLKATVNADLGSVTYQGKKAKDVTIRTAISDKGVDISQARIGDLGGMVIDARGKIDRLNPLSGVAIAAQAKTPDLSATLKALGNKQAENLGASAFTAQLGGNAKALDVALNGTIDQGKLAVNGVAKDLNDAPGFNGKIDVSHPETATILRNFAKMTPKVNLGEFALRTDLAYGGETLKADNLLVKLGSAGTLQGHVNIVPQNGTRRIDADLKADKLALAAMMGDDTQVSAAAVNTGTPAPVEGWSDQAINLNGLRNLNGKANLEIGELLYKKFVIRNLKTTAVFANDAVKLEQLRGGLFDAGNFNVSGQLNPGKEGQAHRGDFTIVVDDTDAVKLFAALGSKPFNKGTLDLNQKINFNGASPKAIIGSLNGDGSFKVTDGVINGIDLDALAAKLDRPNSLGDFAAIIDQARAGGQTAISNLEMPVVIRNGIVQMPNTPIKTAKTAMSLQGNVNLPTQQVDMQGQIQFVEQRNLPALTLLVKGPMHDPQKSFDTRSFTNFYAQKATEKLKEKAMDKLGDVLGLPKAAPRVEAPATEPAVTTPTAPEAPVSPAAAPKKQDPLKQLGNQMLQNLLGGGQ